MRSLMFSTLVCEAASISKISTAREAVMSSQILQALQGVLESPFSQLMALARILAADVLPTPRGPEKMNA